MASEGAQPEDHAFTVFQLITSSLGAFLVGYFGSYWHCESARLGIAKWTTERFDKPLSELNVSMMEQMQQLGIPAYQHNPDGWVCTRLPGIGLLEADGVMWVVGFLVGVIIFAVFSFVRHVRQSAESGS